MTRESGKVHVVRVKKTGYVDKQGHVRDYSSAYLRRTYREAGKVKNETVASDHHVARPTLQSVSEPSAESVRARTDLIA